MFDALRKWAGTIQLSPLVTGSGGKEAAFPESKIREIKADQVELLYKMDRGSGLKPVIAFIATTWVLDGFSSAMPWAALGLYCAAWTWYHSVQLDFLGSKTRRANPEYWIQLFTLASFCTGLAWGLGAVAWFDPFDVANQAIVAVVIMGVGASSIITRCLHHPATLAFLIPASAPIAISLVATGTTFGLLMIGFGIMFVTGLFQWSRLLRGSQLDMTALRYQKETLVESLSAQTIAAEQAREHAEAANKTKSQFLATMSHEVRTPLNGILGMARVLQNSELSEEQKDQLNVIEESGEVLNTVLNDILDLSKLEAGRLDIQSETVNMAKAATSVVRLLKPGAQEKGLKIQVKADGEQTPLAHGDTHRVRQILFNLIGNAIKFTEEGSITVAIGEAGSPLLPRGAGGDLPHGNVVVAITDTGIGLPNDFVPHLFEPFRQADQTTTRKYGGSGLGLSICKRLTDLMGGRINAVGMPGEGSTFWFSLPMASAQSAPEGARRKQVAASDNAAHAASDLGQKFILLAEDNEMNAKVATTMLSKGGHKVVRTSDGEETVAWVNEAVENGQKLPDLILMDIRMPNMSGVEAAEAIRAMDGKAAKLPILALTADIALTDFDGAGRYELPAEFVGKFDGALPKPITLVHLNRAVAEHTGARIRPGNVPKNDPRLDVEQLNSLYANLGPEMVVELVDAFAGDMQSIAQALNEAAGEGDTAEVRARAHNLTGVAANLGFIALADAARKLNRAADARDIDTLKPELKSVRQAIADAEDIVRNIKSA